MKGCCMLLQRLRKRSAVDTEIHIVNFAWHQKPRRNSEVCNNPGICLKPLILVLTVGGWVGHCNYGRLEQVFKLIFQLDVRTGSKSVEMVVLACHSYLNRFGNFNIYSSIRVSVKPYRVFFNWPIYANKRSNTLGYCWSILLVWKKERKEEIIISGSATARCCTSKSK